MKKRIADPAARKMKPNTSRQPGLLLGFEGSEIAFDDIRLSVLDVIFTRGSTRSVFYWEVKERILYLRARIQNAGPAFHFKRFNFPASLSVLLALRMLDRLSCLTISYRLRSSSRQSLANGRSKNVRSPFKLPVQQERTN